MKQQNKSLLLDHKTYRLLIVLISLALVLYPATVLFVPKINGLIFGLLALAGLFFIFIRHHKSAQVSRDEKLFYFSIGIFFLVTLLITINAGFVYKIVGKYLHILLIIPVYIYLRYTGIKLFYLWYGLVVGSIVAAGVAIYDVSIINLNRARGLTHPIVFGDLALVMGCMSMAGMGWFKQHISWQIIFPFFALLCGVLASVLSHSRGSWIAVPFLVVVFLWYINSSFSFRSRITVAILIIVALGALYVIPQTGVSFQIDRTIKSLQQYHGSDISSVSRSSSVGTRLEMWQASLKMYLDNPLLGVGWGHYQENAQLQVDQGLRNQSAAFFDHPHNQFISALANGGSLGFVVTMQLFLIPAWLFIKYIKQGKTEDIKRLALAGLILIVAYMAYGLSEPMLDRSRSVNFFAFYLAIFMAAIHGQLRQKMVDNSSDKLPTLSCRI